MSIENIYKLLKNILPLKGKTVLSKRIGLKYKQWKLPNCEC
jgi:hypothetical protein